MDDFERELAQLMRDTRQYTPFEPPHRQRLHEGIRAERRVRLLWRAGGSAVAVAGLSIALAVLPGVLTRAQPAEPRPLPATSPRPSATTEPASRPPEPSVTPSVPPSTTPPVTGSGGATPEGTTPPATVPPSSTGSGGRTVSAPPPSSEPPPPPTPTATPSAPERTQEASPSVSVHAEST
ncbi:MULTISPECIES: hypothetical protein [unclassified Streptomyces]|uniref:hypothetical protein n=1 Tax=unclassified Streptomyces TaxID=2593676 RepID=UPI000938BC02|nr:hypothetical protein [Streptomyces sp. TSRI0107]OKJ88447.1 hypothetical protein AMK31_08095 [Streptomyces sp. TSRI0107]